MKGMAWKRGERRRGDWRGGEGVGGFGSCRRDWRWGDGGAGFVLGRRRGIDGIEDIEGIAEGMGWALGGSGDEGFSGLQEMDVGERVLLVTFEGCGSA